MLGRWVELRKISCGILLLCSKDSAHVLGENLAKLDTPLVETVDVVHEAFNGNTVLIQSEKLTTAMSGQSAFDEDTERWAVTWEKLVLVKSFRNSLSSKLLKGLTKSKGIWLSKEVRHELIMVVNDFRSVIHRGLRLSETNELGCDSTTLMHQLVEAMLAIRSGFSQDDRSGVNAFIKADTSLADSLSIALHIELLNVGREAKQSLAIGEDCT